MLSRRGVRGRDILMTYHCLSSRRSIFGKYSTVANGHIRLIVLMMGFMTASRFHRSTVCTVQVVHTQQRDMPPKKDVWQVGSASHCSPWAREQRSNEERSKDRCEGWSAPPFALMSTVYLPVGTGPVVISNLSTSVAAGYTTMSRWRPKFKRNPSFSSRPSDRADL